MPVPITVNGFRVMGGPSIHVHTRIESPPAIPHAEDTVAGQVHRSPLCLYQGLNDLGKGNMTLVKVT